VLLAGFERVQADEEVITSYHSALAHFVLKGAPLETALRNMMPSLLAGNDVPVAATEQRRDLAAAPTPLRQGRGGSARRSGAGTRRKATGSTEAAANAIAATVLPHG